MLYIYYNNIIFELTLISIFVNLIGETVCTRPMRPMGPMGPI